MQTNANVLSKQWKTRSKTRHSVAGIRTWHVNLNPRTMPSLGFAKGDIPGQSTTKNVHVDWRGPFAAQAGALTPYWS